MFGDGDSTYAWFSDVLACICFLRLLSVDQLLFGCLCDLGVDIMSTRLSGVKAGLLNSTDKDWPLSHPLVRHKEMATYRTIALFE